VEQLPDKLYYSIGEVATLLNVNTSLIRYWEKEFSSILHPRKSRRGNRLFTRKDIDALRYIYFLVKEQGLTLEGAKKIISNANSDEEIRFRTMLTLQNIRNFLSDIRSSL
jgi:DNA-binding transcriptional MerR regulator